ncbi:traB domain-containing protein-like [Watersipora subatra]|uniref:traB domain-containing protein-like n=1 Tax=Watersipora subatra TaxID=2589382 RepID=UPI00355C3D2D
MAEVFGETSESVADSLPRTCTIVEKNAEREVYIVGTAHFSRESQEDVGIVMQTVQPHVVFLELCKNRLGILELSEERVLEESKDVSFHKLQQSIKKNGVVSGLMQILLLNLSAKITESLGMAPGGEFRRAFEEARRIPHCKVVYGDRPIGITLQRAIGSLSFFQKLKFGFSMITSDIDLSPEDIEKCKEKDMLEQMLTEMAGEFPSLTRVFVDERDVFLAHSLKRSTQVQLGPAGQYTRPIKVVAVLGIGHVNGVVKKWDEDLSEEVKKVLEVPKPTVAGRIVSLTVRTAVLASLAYGSFRLGRGTFRFFRGLVK